MMKTTLLHACCILAMFGMAVGRANAVEPKAADALLPVRLTQSELSGEIGRRINDLIYKNYMAIDERGFLDPFKTRPPAKPEEWRYIGIGKVIDAGSMFAAYTGDPAVRDRTARLIEELMRTRDADGYLGHMPARKQMVRALHRSTLC